MALDVVRRFPTASLLQVGLRHSAGSAKVDFPYEVDGVPGGVISVTYPMSLRSTEAEMLPTMSLGVAVFLGQLCLARSIHLEVSCSRSAADAIGPIASMLYDIRCWKDDRPLLDAPRIEPIADRPPVEANQPSVSNIAETVLLMSGGKDSTLSALKLLERGYIVHGLHMTVNEGVQDLEHNAARRIAALLGIELAVIEVSHPGFLALSNRYAINWNQFPLCNAVPFGRDLLTSILALPVLSATGVANLSLGHDYECRTATVTYEGATFPRNDIESQVGSAALERFVRSHILTAFGWLPPVAHLDEMAILQEMLRNYPALMAETSFCFWGTNCGRCGKCLRYHLAQRLFLDEDLLAFANNPLAEGVCPELTDAFTLPQDAQPRLFQDQILLSIGHLQRLHRVRIADTALFSLPSPTQENIDQLMSTSSESSLYRLLTPVNPRC